jgi:hypothetical protein
MKRRRARRDSGDWRNQAYPANLVLPIRREGRWASGGDNFAFLGLVGAIIVAEN